jgi:hypothetical protein
VNPELWATQQKRGGAISCRVKGAVGRVRPELNELLVETVSDLSRGEAGRQACGKMTVYCWEVGSARQLVVSV